MMSDLLLTCLILLVTQVVTIIWVLGVDALSWKWRSEQKDMFKSLNLLVLFSPLTYPLWPSLIISEWTITGVVSLLWLFLAAWAQRRQLGISLPMAFIGATIQFLAFLIALCIGNAIFGLLWFPMGLLESVWFLSAIAAYFLLTLFRPTLRTSVSVLYQRFRGELS